MSRGHQHSPDGNHDWDAEAGRYNDLIEALEPELSKATQLLLLAAKVGPAKRVLDLACGPGHATAAATAAGALATGLDSSSEMIRHARERFPESQFQAGDMLAPPPGPWDAIVCRLGGHHADPAWIAEAVKVLEPGGWLAIAEPDAVDDVARANGMKAPEEWARIMVNAGLGDVESLRSRADFANIPESVWQTSDDEEHRPPKGPVYVIAGRKPSSA